MSKPYVTLLGKAVRSVARLRGGGSALPGLIVEMIDPAYISRTLAQLPRGVVIISGTNGKTTTTKMVVELLEGQGMRVFTNRTGSNFTRGIAAALLGEVEVKGNLAADIAVLELDEAHAVHFVRSVQPRFTLLLNVMRDQLDRFGEVDATAKLLAQVAAGTAEAVVVNREDPRIVAIGQALRGRKVTYFGVAPELRKLFPSDDDMRWSTGTAHRTPPEADVVLTKLEGAAAEFRLGERAITTTLELQGIYNVYNAAAALALVRAVLGGEIDEAKLIQSLAHVTPAFGRGESLTVGDQPVELVLVKNPGSFRLSLASFPPEGWQTMIAINDNYADGRDTSWLWDADFHSLRTVGVAVVSGSRAYDMALRLQYEEVVVARVEPNLARALRHFLDSTPGQPKRIYCTYSAMLALRRELGKLTEVEVVT